MVIFLTFYKTGFCVLYLAEMNFGIMDQPLLLSAAFCQSEMLQDL